MGLFDVFRCKINVALANQVFFPGNFVDGFVTIECTSDVTMVAVRVKCTGKEWVKCTRGSGKHRHTYVQSNCVFKQLVTLAGHPKCTGNRQSMTLPKGSYKYPFRFQLPMGIPPSFYKPVADDCASIVYNVKAYVDIPNGKDACGKVFFTVVTAMPANQWIHKAPVYADRQWAVTCCCCVDKGNVQGRLSMDRTLIAINRDSLVVRAELDNTAGKEPVESLEISLMNHLSYTARGVTERNVAMAGRCFIKQRIEAGQRGLIEGVVPIPRSIVPSLQTFGISSTYQVQVELNIPMATDPSHVFPVVMTQCVDDTNQSPPVSFHQCVYQLVGKNQYQEFYYTGPPPNCPIPYQPIPNAGSPQAYGGRVGGFVYPPQPAFALQPAPVWNNTPGAPAGPPITADQLYKPPPPLGQTEQQQQQTNSASAPPPTQRMEYGATPQQPPPQQNYGGPTQQQQAARGGGAGDNLLM